MAASKNQVPGIRKVFILDLFTLLVTSSGIVSNKYMLKREIALQDILVLHIYIISRHFHLGLLVNVYLLCFVLNNCSCMLLAMLCY